MVADFIQRVSAYPVVSATWQRASGCYTWAKESSVCARAAADLTEDGLRMAARTAAPLLGKLEGSIATLDQLACRQLDKLEARCPSVKAPTGELVDSTYGYYSSAVKPKVDLVLAPVASAVAKVQSAKDYGLAQYRRLSDGGEWAAWADSCVEHYLPEEKGADTLEAGSTGEEVVPESRSFGGIGRKLRRRVLSRAASEAAAAREEFAARLKAARAATAATKAAANADAAERLAAAARRAQAVSWAGVEFAAARLPELESLPIAGRVIDWLSAYPSEHFNFDPFYHENRRLSPATASAASQFSHCNGGPCGVREPPPQQEDDEEEEDVEEEEEEDVDEAEEDGDEQEQSDSD